MESPMARESATIEAPSAASLAAQAVASGDAAASAFAELSALLGEVEAEYFGPDRRHLQTPE